MYAIEKIPKRIQPKRWCRNGAHPDAWSLRQAVTSLNHSTAYRRRVFLNARAPLESMKSAGAGPITVWRCAMRTGLAVSELRFKMVLGLTGDTTNTNPHVDIEVTVSGGATTTKSHHYGSWSETVNDAPASLAYPELRFDVSPSTVYEIAIKAYDSARPLSVCGYEWADPDVDDARPPFVELAPSVFHPILDSTRSAVLGGLSDLWLSNGIHLLTWPGLGTGAARVITSATYTNVHDGTSTTTSASTPGYYFGAEGTGDGALTSLLPWVRLKDNNDLPVTFAAYAQTSSANATGSVVLNSSTGSGPSVGLIDSTLKWWTTDTTWQNVDAISLSGKVDLQARNTTAGQSISVYAVSIWPRAA